MKKINKKERVITVVLLNAILNVYMSGVELNTTKQNKKFQEGRIQAAKDFQALINNHF